MFSIPSVEESHTTAKLGSVYTETYAVISLLDLKVAHDVSDILLDKNIAFSFCH